MTLQEFLQDYASAETKKLGEEIINKELANIKSDKVRQITIANLAKIKQGERDFRF